MVGTCKLKRPMAKIAYTPLETGRILFLKRYSGNTSSFISGVTIRVSFILSILLGVKSVNKYCSDIGVKKSYESS